MHKSRYRIFCFFVAFSVLLPLVALAADQPFQRFIPLLVDLSGWQGKEADGMSMQMSGASMTTANRDYERGEAQAHAAVLVGQNASGALVPIETGVNIQTPDGHVMSTTMRGMAVLKSYSKKEKSGTLVVALGKDALFSFTYQGISEDEALPLAEKFDWKALQTTAQTK